MIKLDAKEHGPDPAQDAAEQPATGPDDVPEDSEASQNPLADLVRKLRTWHRHRRLTDAPVLPRDDSDSRSLIIVLAVMCYLASLSAAALIAIDGATDRWTLGLTSTVTLRLKPAFAVADRDQFDQQQDEVMALLRGTPGVRSVRPIETDEATRLLTPWLGEDAFAQGLPIPQLMDIEIDPIKPPNMDRLEREIREIAPSARIEDHSKWNDRILAFAGLIQTVTLLLLMIIVITTIIIVTFATHSWLVAKQEIVEALHLIGAHDIFIAKEFQRKFFYLGLQASVWGLVAAFVTIWLMAIASARISVLSTISLLPPINLDLLALLPLLIVPVAMAILTTVTARMTVLRIIEKELY